MKKFPLALALIAMMCGGGASAAEKGRVLIAGSGKSGKPLVKILQDQGYPVTVLTRTAADLGAGVSVVVADVTKPETLKDAFVGVSYVISTIGATAPKGDNSPEAVDFKGVANLVDAAKAANVKQFVLMSSIGAGNASPDAMLNKVFGMVLMWKGKGEDHLRKSGLPYTIVRPGGLGDCDPGTVGLRIATDSNVGEGRICRADVGLVMAASVGNKDALGKTFAVLEDKSAPVAAWKTSFTKLKRD